MTNKSGTLKIRLKAGQTFNLNDGTQLINNSDKTKTYYLVTITSNSNNNLNKETNNENKSSKQ